MHDSTSAVQDQSTLMQRFDLASSPNLRKKSMKIHYESYKNLNGEFDSFVSRVGDGSIIKRFDKTPNPEKPNDVICPHFLELKWGYGCPFKCAWCYLQGTFRFLKTKTNPIIKNRDQVNMAILSLFESNSPPEMLNSGEIGDSLMGESGEPFSKYIIPLIETQNAHKILFLTKSDNIRHLLQIDQHKQAVISFSVNANAVADRWEKGAPSVHKRLDAAKELSDSGYQVRLRIDPIVPIIDWESAYKSLVDDIFKRFIPERITLGSLRGLQSTINNSRDNSWVEYLSERSNWGKKVAFETRFKNFSYILNYLSENNYQEVSLCKETIQMWEKLQMDWKKIKCNCLL
jgi:spore photoproduct lyase